MYWKNTKSNSAEMVYICSEVGLVYIGITVSHLGNDFTF